MRCAFKRLMAAAAVRRVWSSTGPAVGLAAAAVAATAVDVASVIVFGASSAGTVTPKLAATSS